MIIHPLIFKLIASFSLLACLLWYARSNFFRDPGSAFFDPTRAYDRIYSRYRRSEIRQCVESNNFPIKRSPDAAKKPSLCLGVSSVKRRQEQYLETTVASLLCGLSQPEREDLHLSVLIAETDPSNHPTWQQEWVRNATDDLYTYNLPEGSEGQKYLQELEQSHDFGAKGIFDYVYALERCYDAGTPYIAMIEDDIILADGWMVRTLSALKQVSSIKDGPQSWLYMRLFNQERSIGWASSEIGGNHEFWIILGIAAAILTPALTARRMGKPPRGFCDLGTLYIVALIINPALVILFFQSGKASMLPPAAGVFNEPFGCCSQAMVYPREQVSMLIEFFRERQTGQVDLLLNDLALMKGLDRYSLYPVLAQHIGIDSARMTLKTEAQAIWSMAFENLNPASLQKSHVKMVNEYYGQSH